ncbi:MAG: hypothetical protein ACRED4_09535 [Brevundimonas sp.]
MQQLSRPLPLRSGHPRPVGAARLARGGRAGPRRDAVKDRPVQRLVDDLVFGGHGIQPLVFNAANLSRSVAGLYLEKSEKVQ